MLETLYEALKAQEGLEDVTIRSFERPDSLSEDAESIVIVPLTSPRQAVMGSDTSLAKRYLYQVNAESPQRKQAKVLQNLVEKVMEEHNFRQTEGGLEAYFKETRRYVDARTYRGLGPLYQK